MVDIGCARGGNRAASDGISVVLVVAVTIVLAARVGTVLLDLVTDTSTQSPDTVLDVTLCNATSGARGERDHPV